LMLVLTQLVCGRPYGLRIDQTNGIFVAISRLEDFGIDFNKILYLKPLHKFVIIAVRLSVRLSACLWLSICV
jgi:hypothetical protein